MNENLKTLTFVVAAAAVALVAWVSNPSLRTPVVADVRNQPLYPDFKNPQSAASLEIVKFDEARGVILPFKVAEVEHKGKTRWSIPSHDDYPADAKDQVASAATALMGLRIIDKVSDNQGDQEEYGVVDPDPKVLKLGASGVGDKVVMCDKNGKELLALVVGKAVPDRPSLRYVRRVGDSAIYIVEAKTDKLSTKFEDWIEPNLLQINTMDLKSLLIHDYAIKVTLQGLEMRQNDKIRIAYNDAGDPHWKMLDNQQFVADDKETEGGKWAPVKMAADEELNTAKLDELKSALDDLKIVDVSRKPLGMSADLKVSADFSSRHDAKESLASKGFFVLPLVENGPEELFSNEGEFKLLMKNGVEYVLRFGQITGSGPAAKDTKQKDKGKSGEKKGTGLNRYLFVMAEFNPDAIPKPQLEPLPEPGKAKEPEKKSAEKKPADKKAEDAERARIEKENKRKQEEYDQQIADGKKRVAELNARFADWYYVISDEVYQKIHLGRGEIVMKKPKKDAEKSGDGKKDSPAALGNADAAKPPATPINELEKLKKAGPSGKK